MFKTMLAATALAATVLAAATPAAAKTGAWQVGNDSMHLYNDDLDMNSAAGRAALLARIERAAGWLCRDQADQRACISETVAQTSRQPQAAMLRLAMAERTGIRLAAR